LAVAEESAHTGHDEHHGPEHLAHHFHDIDQQRESATLGMWLFVAQEVMFFGGLMAAYTLYRAYYPQTWVEGSMHLSLGWGFVNTLVLLTSSLTMALAVRQSIIGNSQGLFRWLAATLFFGFVFLGIKYIEYSDKWEHFLIPGIRWSQADWMSEGGRHQLFFVLYFIMTGMHALHMVIGIAILIVLMWMATKNRRFCKGDYMPIELFGFYWHFVDIVWVFLFPLLYLVDRSGGAH